MTTLFADSPPAHRTGRCPRCRLRKGQTAYRCRRCGAMLADAEQWLWLERWATANSGLLRQAIRRVRPSWAKVDRIEIVMLSLPALVRALLGWNPCGKAKWPTWAANGVTLAAMKLDGGCVGATGVDLSSVTVPPDEEQDEAA